MRCLRKFAGKGPLSEAEHAQRLAAAKASAEARHRAETTPSVKQGSTGAPSKQAVALFRQGQARPDTRAKRGVWDTRSVEPGVGSFNGTVRIHLPKAYRGNPDRPKISPRSIARAQRALAGVHQDMAIVNPRDLAEAHRHPAMRQIITHAVGVVRDHQAGTIARGHEQGMIPEGTKPGTIVRAYKHAGLRAMHHAGLIDYDTKMDPEAKAEFQPLVPFMRYAYRRVFDHMNQGPLKGKWAPFRNEYGQLFRSKKYGKLTGAQRMRMRPAELIKIAPIAGCTRLGADGLFEVLIPPMAIKGAALAKDYGDSSGFYLSNPNIDPAKQLARAMHPRIRRQRHALRLNTQRHLKRLLSGGVTRQERWQLRIGVPSPVIKMAYGDRLTATRLGEARHGEETRGTATHGLARHGRAWQGGAWHGAAWMAKREVGDPLTSAELEQRRMAAKARWAKYGVSRAAIAKPVKAAFPQPDTDTSPKEMIRAMRRWGRSNRTERGIITNPAMTRVIARNIGTASQVNPGRRFGEDFDASTVPRDSMTLIHNHPSGAPISSQDIKGLVHRQMMIREHLTANQHLLSDKDQKELKAQLEKVPNYKRIFAADPRGDVSLMHLKMSPEEAEPHITRAVALFTGLIGRRMQRPSNINRMAAKLGSVSMDSPAGFSAIQESHNVEVQHSLLPIQHGMWKELHDRGVIHYRSTGNWGKSAERIGRQIVRMADTMKAPDAAKLLLPKGTGAETQTLVAKALKGLFKRAPLEWDQFCHEFDAVFDAELTKTNPALAKRLLTEAEVRAAARQAVTPSAAQAEAGNYTKPKLTIGGLRISIETAKGMTRSGTNKGGKSWSVTMPAHYGYVLGSNGADGDHVDVYLGPRAHQAERYPVFVVDQIDNRTGKFDEHKAMLGFPTEAAAVACYDKAFSDGNGPERRKAVHTMSFDAFKAWLQTDTTKALGKGLLGALAGAGIGAAVGRKISRHLAGATVRRTASGAYQNALQDAVRVHLKPFETGVHSPQTLAHARMAFRAAKKTALQGAIQQRNTGLAAIRGRRLRRGMIAGAAVGGYAGLHASRTRPTLPPLYQSAAQPDDQS